MTMASGPSGSFDLPPSSFRLSRQRGFGLGLGGSFFDTIVLPLLIIGVLVLIAIPAYDDYKAKAHLAGEIKALAPAKAAIEKEFAARGPSDMSQLVAKGLKLPPTTDYVRGVTIARDGKITVRVTEKVAEAGHDEIQIVPVSGGKPLDLSLPASAGRKFEWQCGGPAGKTTLPEKRRPTDCRP